MKIIVRYVGWDVLVDREDSKRPKLVRHASDTTQEGAVEAAVALAKTIGATVVVEGRDGEIQRKHDYE